MLWIDIKYANLLSVQLERYAVKQQNPFLANFRCPICGDSRKNKNRARGYLFTKSNGLFYKCHNCGVGTSLGNLVKTVNPGLFDQYKLERYTEGLDIGNAPRPHAKVEFQNFTPQFEEKSPLDRLFDKVSELPNHNIGVRYLESRKLPHDKWSNIYFAYETKKLTELCPDYDQIITFEEPRIIIPFYDRQNNLVGVTARAVDNPGGNRTDRMRYVTLRIDKMKPMVYNLNNVDTTKEVYVTEGPLDSMFLTNAVAAGNADLTRIENEIPKGNTTLVFDNQPRSHEIVKIMKNAMTDGWKMCVWPDKLNEKDINEMIIAGKSISEVEDLINTNTHSGLSLRLKLNAWSKC